MHSKSWSFCPITASKWSRCLTFFAWNQKSLSDRIRKFILWTKLFKMFLNYFTYYIWLLGNTLTFYKIKIFLIIYLKSHYRWIYSNCCKNIIRSYYTIQTIRILSITYFSCYTTDQSEFYSLYNFHVIQPTNQNHRVVSITEFQYYKRHSYLYRCLTMDSNQKPSAWQ